jgi:pyruvate ferredoxin oxidoreductase alpha subunit
MHAKQVAALDEIPRIADDFAIAFGRDSGGLVQPYRVEDAETVVVALGSVLGTIEEVVDAMRVAGSSVGALAISCFRPWPLDEVRDALRGAKRVVVVEKAFAVGAGGIVGQNVRLALSGLPTEVYDVVAGLGGRAITQTSLRGLLTDVIEGRMDARRLHFLDLDVALVERELARASAGSSQGVRSGPHAENMLRDLGAVASGPVQG